MKDANTTCQHTLPECTIYKDVVVIGNGPSGMVTSFMLAGNVPYLKHIPEDLPIDDMLRARLSNLPPDQSLYDVDLSQLAEGLEGRSQNPIPLLMDSLLRPCADLGIQADPLIEWRYEGDKQVDHVVLGRGPAGGAWHSFPAGVRSLSPAAWLSLPPHSAPSSARLEPRAVAAYCRRYVRACRLQRYFRYGVVVTSVTRLPEAGLRCRSRRCPLNATFCVTGYDEAGGGAFRYACRLVVVASGAAQRPGRLPAARPALHSPAALQRALGGGGGGQAGRAGGGAALVVGSGVSAADGVRLARAAGLAVRHVHRAPAAALARLAPQLYPEYYQVYKMMCDGPSGNHPNYTSYPDHIVLDVTSEPDHREMASEDDYPLTPKRVTLLNLATNETVKISVVVIVVLIGSRPDLSFLQTNFTPDCIQMDCLKCTDEVAKRKMEEKQCFLKNHWHYLKSVLGQSIQSCKSKYLNYSEINGNTDVRCAVPDCNKRNDSCTCKDSYIINECKCYSNIDKNCECDNNPYAGGIGFGLDPTKPVDGRGNPVAIDKTTHELVRTKGVYALGPLTGDNFIRFIPGGALALVSHIHKSTVDLAE